MLEAYSPIWSISHSLGRPSGIGYERVDCISFDSIIPIHGFTTYKFLWLNHSSYCACFNSGYFPEPNRRTSSPLLVHFFLPPRKTNRVRFDVPLSKLSIPVSVFKTVYHVQWSEKPSEPWYVLVFTPGGGWGLGMSGWRSTAPNLVLHASDVTAWGGISNEKGSEQSRRVVGAGRLATSPQKKKKCDIYFLLERND